MFKFPNELRAILKIVGSKAFPEHWSFIWSCSDKGCLWHKALKNMVRVIPIRKKFTFYPFFSLFSVLIYQRALSLSYSLQYWCVFKVTPWSHQYMLFRVCQHNKSQREQEDSKALTPFFKVLTDYSVERRAVRTPSSPAKLNVTSVEARVS